MMEKAIMMNSYQPMQAIFRDLTELPGNLSDVFKPIFSVNEIYLVEKAEVTETSDPEQNLMESMGLSRPRPKDRYRTEDMSPKLKLLWTFKCKLLTGYIPLCIEYNKENTV